MTKTVDDVLQDRDVIRAQGMKRAARIAAECSITHIQGLDAQGAADAMRQIIIGAIEGNANALEASVYRRESGQ